MRSRWGRPEATRPLPLEELAELQVEQGYPERALRIYENLAEHSRDPAAYANRLANLRRGQPVALPEIIPEPTPVRPLRLVVVGGGKVVPRKS